MSRRVPEVAIRGADLVTLEVQCQDLLRRPFVQLATVNAFDLVALLQNHTCPASLKFGLGEFVARIRREIADVPNGRSWVELVEELAEVHGSRVPHDVRSWLLEEGERPDRSPEKVAALLQGWADVEPANFDIGTGRARMVRARAAPMVDERPRAAERAAPKERAPKAPRVATPKPAPEPLSDQDTERMTAIRNVSLERLGGVGDAGLAEPVLVAGVRHRLKEQYPTLPPHEVFAVLKELVAQGRVRLSAGRYRRAGRW